MNGKQTKLSKWLYLLLLGEYDGGIHQHKWIHFIKHILISVGCPDLLNKKVIENPRSYFYKSPNIIKFKELFSSANTRKLVKLSSFVEIIMNKYSCAA